jgi:hypothetical protein
MSEGSDILVRIGAGVFGVVFLRDAVAALRGTRLLITKGYSTHIFEGWQSRLIGLFLFATAIALLGVAWFGL